MKKYAINYTRTFPDHRVPIDYTFNKELMKGPSAYFRLVKDGFNATATKNFQIILSLFTTFGLMAAAFWLYYRRDGNEMLIGRKNFPGYKYLIMTNRGGYGTYDTILQKFQKEEGGVRDLPWTQ